MKCFSLWFFSFDEGLGVRYSKLFDFLHTNVVRIWYVICTWSTRVVFNMVLRSQNSNSQQDMALYLDTFFGLQVDQTLYLPANVVWIIEDLNICFLFMWDQNNIMFGFRFKHLKAYFRYIQKTKSNKALFRFICFQFNTFDVLSLNSS